MKISWENPKKTGVILTELGGVLDHVGLDSFIPYNDDTNPESVLLMAWEKDGGKIDPFVATETKEAEFERRIAALEAK